MEESDLVYLAGLVDGMGSLGVNVSEHSNYAVGYRYEPKLRISQFEADEVVLGLLDEYCVMYDVAYQIEERSGGDSVRFIIQSPENIARFLEPICSHLIRLYEDAELMLTEVIPRVQNDEHHTKQGFYEMMEYADRLRGSSGRGRNPKYTQSWFAEEWAGEVSV